MHGPSGVRRPNRLQRWLFACTRWPVAGRTELSAKLFHKHIAPRRLALRSDARGLASRSG
jgi:hypothetical protein